MPQALQLLKHNDTIFRRIDRSQLREQIRNMRLWEYFRWYVDQEKVGKVRPVTLVKYRSTEEHLKRIAPEMLVVDLEANRRNMQWLLDRYGETHRHLTTLDFKSHVTAAMNFAVDEGYIASFPHHGLEIRSSEKSWSPEKKERVKSKPLTFSATEFTKFKAYIDFKLDEMLDKEPIYLASRSQLQRGKTSEQALYLMYAVGIHTGARFAEVIGFKYEDISEKGLSINKTWNYKDRDNQCYQPTKNDSSIRTTVIDGTLRSLINRYWTWKQRYGLHMAGTPLLVEKGSAPFNETINDKLYKIEEKLKLPLISFHKLRHTYVSVLIDRGISEGVIAKQVGHANTDMIHRVYGHLLKEREERELSAIEGLMG